MKAKRMGALVGIVETNNADQDATRENQPTELDIEKEWLDRARVDPEAFAFFYKKYRRRIFGQIFLMTNDMDVAADLTAATFAIAIVMLDTFRWRGHPFGAWLATIARNLVARDSYRRRIWREVRFDPNFHDHAGGIRPDHEVERQEEARILVACLDRLRASQRLTIERYYYEEQTTREIAAAVGVAESTAKSRLQDGRRQLGVLLVECGVDWRADRAGRGVSESTLEGGQKPHNVDG